MHYFDVDSVDISVYIVVICLFNNNVCMCVCACVCGCVGSVWACETRMWGCVCGCVGVSVGVYVSACMWGVRMCE